MLDFLRIIATVQASFVALATIWIVCSYIPVIRSAEHQTKKLLAWHIVVIGTSYTIATISLCIDMLVRYGDNATWRLPLAFVAFTLGDLGLCLMIWRLWFMRKFYSYIESPQSEK